MKKQYMWVPRNILMFAVSAGCAFGCAKAEESSDPMTRSQAQSQSGVPVQEENENSSAAPENGDRCDDVCSDMCREEYTHCQNDPGCHQCIRNGEGCDSLSVQQKTMAVQACRCSKKKCRGVCGVNPCSHLPKDW